MSSQPYVPDDKLSIDEFGLEEPQRYLAENQLIIPDPLPYFAQSYVSAVATYENRKSCSLAIEMTWPTYFRFS